MGGGRGDGDRVQALPQQCTLYCFSKQEPGMSFHHHLLSSCHLITQTLLERCISPPHGKGIRRSGQTRCHLICSGAPHLPVSPVVGQSRGHLGTPVTDRGAVLQPVHRRFDLPPGRCNGANRPLFLSRKNY